MADTRANIKLNRGSYERLKDAKNPEQSWGEFLTDLLDEKATVVSDEAELPDEQVREIARASADEIEERLR